jgi:hypothetical protein
MNMLIAVRNLMRCHDKKREAGHGRFLPMIATSARVAYITVAPNVNIQNNRPSPYVKVSLAPLREKRAPPPLLLHHISVPLLRLALLGGVGNPIYEWRFQ